MLPLALSTPAWTVVGALGGALIGATAGGSVDAYFAWRRRNALAKAGARLVALDIAIFDSQLGEVQTEGKWWRYHGTPMTNWPEYRAVLAEKLSNEAFEAVSQAVSVLGVLNETMPEAPAFRDPGTTYVEVEPTVFNGARDDAASAYDALAKLAGHDRPVGGRIHPPETSTQ